MKDKGIREPIERNRKLLCPLAAPVKYHLPSALLTGIYFMHLFIISINIYRATPTCWSLGSQLNNCQVIIQLLTHIA